MDIQTTVDVNATANLDLTEQAMQLLAQVLDLWIMISILVTLTVVQGGKAVLKHYTKGKIDKFTQKLILFVFAFIVGFGMTYFFVDKIDVEKWAVAIGFLNPLIYVVLLWLAEQKGWTRMVGIMKMRKVIKTKTEDGDIELELSDATVFLDRD